jgi:hypothetical protein
MGVDGGRGSGGGTRTERRSQVPGVRGERHKRGGYSGDAAVAASQRVEEGGLELGGGGAGVVWCGGAVAEEHPSIQQAAKRRWEAEEGHVRAAAPWTRMRREF